MKKINYIAFTILTVLFLSSCDFINNTLTYKETVEALINDIVKKDYNKAITHFALEHPSFSKTGADTLKAKLPIFHDLIVNNFGEHLDFTFMSSEKKWSTVASENTPPNTTITFIQIANDEAFGVLKVWFDDNSQKVIYIEPVGKKESIPNMTTFWLFGILALCIPAFNIYMIVKIKRSNLKKKWLKYFAIICLNVPSITYNAVGGLSFGLLNFQILFGISFGYMAYLGSYWTFGLPLGGLYLLRKLYLEKKKLIIEATAIPEILLDTRTLNNEIEQKEV